MTGDFELLVGLLWVRVTIRGLRSFKKTAFLQFAGGEVSPTDRVMPVWRNLYTISCGWSEKYP